MKEDMSVGYLASSFDLLNVQNLDVIAQAKVMCSRLVVGVYSDAFAERVSGRCPVVPLVERMTLVRHVRGVSEAVVHDDDEVGLNEVTVCLSVDRRGPVHQVAPTLVLVPRRDTASAALRAALRSLREDEQSRHEDVA